MAARKKTRLSDKAIRGKSPGRYPDGDGLILQVTPNTGLRHSCKMAHPSFERILIVGRICASKMMKAMADREISSAPLLSYTARA